MRVAASRAMAAPSIAVDESNSLVLKHLGLVKTLASRLAHRVPSHIELSELISVGMMGLVEASRRFEPSRGVPFDAFARRRIHGAMVDALRELDSTPRSVRKLRRQIDDAILRLRHTLKREPTAAEIAGQLHISEDDYDRLLDHIRSSDIGAVRQLETGPDGAPIVDIAIEDDGTELRLERAELRRHLVEAIQMLPERERRILELYHEHDLTLAEIGAVIGVGESRVSQLRTQAIARLRASLRESLHMEGGGR
ncbi:MAG TPA: RNA polymerase sigma factor FliA [Vicinamibacterales bacterium]|nr:RNA polymerase sigma factor FliA [Vicinamibacterales bacterium]